MSIEDTENTPQGAAGSASTPAWDDGEGACVLLGLSDLYAPGALSMAECMAADLLILAPHPVAADLLRRSLGSAVTQMVEFRDPGADASPLTRQVAVVRWVDHLLATRRSLVGHP